MPGALTWSHLWKDVAQNQLKMEGFDDETKQPYLFHLSTGRHRFNQW